MLKSIFSKYIMTFVALLLVSILLIGGVFTSLINSYSMNMKQKELARTATSFSIFLKQAQAQEGESLTKWVNEEAQLLAAMIPVFFPDLGDMALVLTDPEGQVILVAESVEGTGAVYTGFQVTGAHTLKGTGLAAPLLDDIVLNGELRDLGDAAGLLRARGLVYGTGVYDEMGRLIGIVVVHTENQSMDAMLRTTTRAMTIAAFWIALAALVGVYILSERIIRPLKHMSRAAKHFAAGQFDIRVPVAGGDEIAELATAFNQMADSLARNEDMRRTFLANVSHDLRTPMTTISGYIDNILAGAIKPEEYERYLGIISREVKRLSRLVSSLLDISRMQAGERKFDFAEFDACELARQVLISFEQKITEKRLEVEFDCDRDRMPVYADRDAIHQVLYNLCDNAVKFAREGGHYLLTLRDQKDKIYVSVYNDGEGIPESDIPYVFDRFYKSDRSRGLDKTGVGLGLYISRTIMESHGERIWVESDFGNNCMFTFSLKRADRTEETSRAGRAGGEAKGRTI